MKQFQSTLALILLISLTAQEIKGQRTHSVKDIFYLLPDTVFTSIHQLNFATKDSFPIKERDIMIENFDARKKTFTAKDPRFHIASINEKSNLLTASNGDLSFDIKLWSLSNNETLIAVDGYYKEDMYSQTIKFYNYKGGKITSVNALPESFPVSLFFETEYVKKKGLNPSLETPDLYIVFSKTGGDELQVRVQKESFDEQIVGPKATMAQLAYTKIKRPDIILNLHEGKFVIIE